MPTHDYQCQNCNEIVELFKTFDEDYYSVCPFCGDPSLKIVYLQAPSAFVKDEPKTVGLRGERNRQAMSRQQYEETRRKMALDRKEKIEIRKGSNSKEGMAPTKKELPFWRTGKVDTSLAELSKKKQQEYIKTGKK